jgi:predicted site-specific integrase-resolvase
MPVVIDDQNFYRPAEVCRMIGISRNALFMWSKEGIIPHVEYRDRGAGDYSPQPRQRPLERRRAMLR